MNAFAPAHDILLLIAYAQTPHLHLNAHAVASGWATGLKVGLCPNLHPYLVYASSEGSGASVKL